MSEQRALDNRCVDCRYFDPRDSEEQPPNPGYCVRFPPVLARAGEDPAWRSAWSFPVVMGGGTDRCGEFHLVEEATPFIGKQREEAAP
jgi:hypothetical protein